MKLTIRHIDTCLPDYVLDHCNGEREELVGAEVWRHTRHYQLKDGLRMSIRDCTSKLPDEITDADVDAALADLFEGAHPLKVFDRTLAAVVPEDETPGAYAWFRLTW